MKLTNIVVQNAKPREKSYKLSDGHGLYLEVSPKGGKWWRYKFSFDGKETRISLGVYPEVSLKEARDKLLEVRKQRAKGINPSANRKALKATRKNELENSFEVVAREWFAARSAELDKRYASRLLRRLEKDVFPFIGTCPIADITVEHLESVGERIEKRGALDVVSRVMNYCKEIYTYAVRTKRAKLQNDPSEYVRPFKTAKTKHHAAIIEPKKLGALLRAIDGYKGYFATECALKLSPLFFVRPGELRAAEWSEIDFDKAEWNIPAERMKMKEAHLVPLSPQAVKILKELHLVTGKERYVFPSVRTVSRPMSDGTVNASLRRMGYLSDEMTAHGFRAIARTILDEELGFRPDIIEHQLAHAVKDPMGRAYNRTSHLPERRRMMQVWADYLDVLKGGAQVISLSGRGA